MNNKMSNYRQMNKIMKVNMNRLIQIEVDNNNNRIDLKKELLYNL